MRENLLKFIDELSDFLLRENPISNCHLVDFMTADLFRVLLPSVLQEELMDMSPADLSLMPTGIVDSQRFPHCEKFLSECRKFSPCQLAQMFPMSFSTDDTDDHTDQFHIGPQKSYEVGRMTSLVSHLAIKNSITQV